MRRTRNSSFAGYGDEAAQGLGTGEVIHLKRLYHISNNSLDRIHPCKSQFFAGETLRCRRPKAGSQHLSALSRAVAEKLADMMRCPRSCRPGGFARISVAAIFAALMAGAFSPVWAQ